MDVKNSIFSIIYVYNTRPNILGIQEEKFIYLYYNNFNMRIKRLIDITMAAVIGIVCLPIMLLAALIVKLESRGPVLFVQERTGELNRPFDIY